MTRTEWKQAIKNKALLDWKPYHEARSHFPLCKIKSVVLHHKIIGCTNYEEWNVNEMVPMFKWCHLNLHHHSEETRHKISEAHKGKSRIISPEHKARIAESQRKYYEEHPETKKEIGEAFGKINKNKLPWNKGLPMSREQKEKLSETRKGKPSHKRGIPLSEDMKKKISDARKGHLLTKEHKIKISLAKKGITPKNYPTLHSKENVQKRSSALKGKPWSPSRRAAYEKSKNMEVL
ncbi:MAG: hypothetical protein LBK63_06345 [Treponema sp.]|jgi:hypothetical protein|nr:hypothetical protein [Treponema sp.]